MMVNVCALQFYSFGLSFITSAIFALISLFLTLNMYGFNFFQIRRELKVGPCHSELSFLCSLVHFTCPQVNSSPN